MTTLELLTRDEFRTRVFGRDRHRCVVCKAPAADAHHIVERRLFEDEGYYLDNGASLCGEDHLRAEMTTLSCEEVREAAGITRVVLPPDFYPDERYDKWGNPFVAPDLRARGELFFDESVQKILARGGVLGQFTEYVKYPRTRHLPWSPGASQKGERTLQSLAALEGERVVVTAKMDGEQTTMYPGYLHARSIHYRGHPSRHWVKRLHSEVGYLIPERWRVCGENLYARHSIVYRNLPSYFLLFSVWDAENYALSWDETLEWAALLGLATVPALYDGPWDEQAVRDCLRAEWGGDECEGYVVRVARRFHFREFKSAVGKYVREGHVQTHGGWMRSEVVPNGLAADASEGAAA